MSNARDLANVGGGGVSVDSGAPDNSLVVNSSGSVGIGASSPAYKLDARLSGTSSGAVIQVGNTGSGGFGGLGVSDGGTYPLQIWGSSLAFLSGNSSYASATERMRIDSAGRVTMPYQPAFFARPSSDPTNGVVICNLVDINVGSHYNDSNGRFTAPINGLYYFSAITNGGAGTSAIALRFRKNQTTVPGFQAYIMDVDDSPNISGIMYLTAGDYIDLVTDVTSIASTPWTHFSGYLIG